QGRPGRGLRRRRNDVVRGGQGDDTLRGEDGSDVLKGQADDELRCLLLCPAGPAGIDGGDGNDRVYGGQGADDLFGGNDNDYLKSHDNVAGNDSVDGEANTDTCVIDAGDTVANCELQ